MLSVSRKSVYCILLAVVLVGCLSRPPIKIGVAVELTGRRGELGVAARDGAQLAVEQINERGGVNGRPIELIVRDDGGDPDTARRVDADLVAQGVVAIVGHVTSAQTAAAFEQMNEAEVVLISPTSSSTQFSAQADYFFRVMPSNDLMGKALAVHMYINRGVRQIVGVYDLSNRAFTETYWESIRAEFERLGGEAGTAFGFTPGETDQRSLMGQRLWCLSLLPSTRLF
jgi:branched-chain amino acid transport system substrate-binding protein